MVSALVFPIVFLLGLAPAIYQIIALVAYAMVTIGVLCVVFAQKVYRLRAGVQVGDNMEIAKDPKGNESVRLDNSTSLRAANEASLQGKKPAEAYQLCCDQIEKWKSIL